MIDASVEHDVVRAAEAHSRRIADSKVDLESRPPGFLSRALNRQVDEIDRGHAIPAARKFNGVRAGAGSDFEHRLPGQQSGVQHADQFDARDAGIPRGVPGPV